MSQETERFLEAEQAAQAVLEALTRLKAETISYKTATQELDAVRERLLGLINDTESVSIDTHQVVSLLKGIGGPEILERINRLKMLGLSAIAVSSLSLAGVLYLILRTLSR